MADENNANDTPLEKRFDEISKKPEGPGLQRRSIVKPVLLADENNANDTPLETDHEEAVEAPSLRRRSIVSEYIDFLMHNKKWWMIPIIVVVVVLGLAIVLLGGAGAAVAPFIYVLF